MPWTRAPYGYRLDVERPRDPALLTIDAPQAATISELFYAYADGGVSLHKLAVGLTERGLPSPTGKGYWTANTIRLILSNPCYTGTAYSNRTRMKRASRRKSPLQPVGTGEWWGLTTPEEWIPISVPAIIDQAVFDRVQARLATNQQLAQRSTRHDYLLRNLVSCGSCRLQCHGRFRAPAYCYYVCNGRQPAVTTSHAIRCHARHIPADQLDTLVWADLCEVLQHPELISQALERAHSGRWMPEELQHRRQTIHKGVRSLEQQRERLLTAYLAGVIELPEFERRQRELVQQREALEAQDRQVVNYSRQVLHIREVTPSIQAICERLRVGLDQATFAQRRQLVELLIDCVVVTDGDVEIRYVIPTTEASTHIRFCHLRKDYFNPVPFTVDGAIERTRAALVLLAGDRHADPALTEVLANAFTAISLVADDALRSSLRAAPVNSPHVTALHYLLEHHSFVAVARRDAKDHGFPATFRPQMDLGAEAALAPA